MAAKAASQNFQCVQDQKASTPFPVTPQSQVITRSRKRKRSMSPPPSQAAPISTNSLLLALPGLLTLPPNHRAHCASYILSLRAIRKCLSLESLPPDVECRALTVLAELGFKLVKAGWCTSDHFPWASELENEVENAIGKGLVLAQRTSSLAVYKQTLTLLHSRLAHWQQNTKFSRSLLKRLTSSFTYPTTDQVFDAPGTPSWLVYTSHLTSISHALSLTPPDYSHAFSSLQDLQSSSERHSDRPISVLSLVLRLRTLVDAGSWDEVGVSLALAEGSLGLSYDSDESSTAQMTEKKSKEQTFDSFEEPFEAAMVIHILVMAVIYYTHMGSAKAASKRLTHLHALLDSDALCLFPDGVIEVKLSSGPPLTIKCTHPRVLYQLAYLVSSVAKRDAVGRKPKRKVFANEGINNWENEVRREISLPRWADPSDADEVIERMVKMKADLLCELVAVCIMRSEFDAADGHISSLIAFTRSYGLFGTYAARITLHHAHFAHALCDTERARQCYLAAAHLSQEGTFVNVSARAGHVALLIGCGVPLRDVGRELQTVIKMCSGMGGTLEAVGCVLQACLSSEILAAKTSLKMALDLASRAQDNHLRALILALISALYLRTAESHARTMLETCGQLAAGLGAPPHKADGKDVERGATCKLPEGHVGNAPLGLWVGEQFLDIYKRDGNQKKATKQEQINTQLANAMQELSRRHYSQFQTDNPH